MSERRFYTVEEVAEQLQCEVATVKALLRERELHSVQIGGEPRVPSWALDKFARRAPNTHTVLFGRHWHAFMLPDGKLFCW